MRSRASPARRSAWAKAYMQTLVERDVQTQDFRGLRRLQAHTGRDFITGIVLYDGDKALRFGDGMWAVPLAAL
ncbi:MAG: hypothetical protein Q8S32_08435 [Burkholderiaceae bacterium]|nr:hypothetical protein [Burkholderiaceae bacterium]